jgi:hypothetical protein
MSFHVLAEQGREERVYSCVNMQEIKINHSGQESGD